MPLPPRFAEVTFEHVQQLVDAGEREGMHLDYKQKIPDLGPEPAKKEFRADVAAFANAGGGETSWKTTSEHSPSRSGTRATRHG